MKLKKMIAAIVVGVMAWMTVGTAMALVKEGVVSPMYAHTRRVESNKRERVCRMQRIRQVEQIG